MSFYLARRDPSGDLPVPAITDRAQQHGFRPAPGLRVGSWRFDFFDNVAGNGLHRLDIGADRHLIGVGLVIYDGHSGADALKALARDRDTGEAWQDKLRGHFTLIMIANGQAELFCDILGAHKIYHDAGPDAFSNSFLALLATQTRPHFDTSGVYDFALNGALHCGQTLISGCRHAPAGRMVTLGDQVGESELWSLVPPEPELRDIGTADAVAMCLEPLRAAIGDLVAATGGKLRLSLSGGFDSRLLLALMLEAGARPELFVYGSRGDGDVEAALAIARTLGLDIRHIDKSTAGGPLVADMPSILERNLVMFDGWKNHGLFDNGNDRIDRQTRHEGGFIPVNGGLGGIFRNFFNIFDGSYSIGNLIDAFYRQYIPEWFTDAFDETGYLAKMTGAMRAQCHESGPILSPQQTQLMYPLFRGRFWTGRDGELNQRFGAMAFPFMDKGIIRTVARMPLRLKTYGTLQALMITELNPELSAIQSSYGFPFDRPLTLRWRLGCMKSLMRPTGLRPWLWRNFRRESGGFSPELDQPHLAAVIDPSMPVMASYFRIAALDNEAVFNRVASLEYLARQFDIAAG